MARVTVKVANIKGFVKNELNRLRNLSDRQLRNIALKTEEVMKRSVQASITRANSSGNLENNITAEKIQGGWGIGNIPKLNEVAPYWRHVNFGSEAIGASHNHRVPQGSFSPGGAPIAGGSGGRWQVGSGAFSFIPKNPIAPLNYIAKTLQEVSAIIGSELRGTL